jgi:uncharacterized membrane protein
MDPLENDAETIRPSSRKIIILVLLIIACQIVISLIAYPFLPEQIPLHWNIQGQINSYGPKLMVLAGMPLVSALLFFGIRGLTMLGPRLGGIHQLTNLGWTEKMLIGLPLFMLAIQLVTIAVALKMVTDSVFYFDLLSGLVFIFLGNYMGKLRRNFWAGIRTPWTLVSDVSWERTHRLGGWLFVLAGFMFILSGFVPVLRVWGTMVMLALIVALLVVYSYVVYRRAEHQGRN